MRWNDQLQLSQSNDLLMTYCYQKGERPTPYTYAYIKLASGNPAPFGPDYLIFEQIQLPVLENHLLVLFALNEVTQLMKGSDITRATGKDGRCSTCPPSSSIRSAPPELMQFHLKSNFSECKHSYNFECSFPLKIILRNWCLSVLLKKRKTTQKNPTQKKQQTQQ